MRRWGETRVSDLRDIRMAASCERQVGDDGIIPGCPCFTGDCPSFQENAQMFQGHPCPDMYPDEYFPHGITNGAHWYNVPGKNTPESEGDLLSGVCKPSLPT